ncbi:adenylate cyclase type 1 [Holotrichia oblita]|uniref:Adenylate cyclase type 1 n=2 Tax=Holotrichia oblita TaxID=644536 RepID=A0ACB9TRM8_HOLOL|nr:adenylate cyclase type 1 [Holotrichia oblita]
MKEGIMLAAIENSTSTFFCSLLQYDFIYPLSNSYEAQRIYRERYPLRQVPNVRTFIDVHRRLREDGCFRKPKLNSGVSRTRRTVRNEETVLRMVENNPRTSTRKTSSADSLQKVTLDLVLYGTLLILPVFGLLVSERYVKNHPKLLLVLSAMAFVLLFLANILVPIVHYVHDDEYLRPIYTTLLIISCYVFLHVTSNVIAVCLGFIVTIAHLLILNFITYSDSTEFNWGRLGSDLLYLICLNGFGIYFRLITELIKMRSFLDKRTCVESTTKLRAEKEQREKLMLSIIPKHIMEEVFTQIYEVVKNEQVTHPINDPHIDEYENVTILYADIVNYTQMTSTLKSLRLVETLHELFGRFDDASRDLKVQRIKFLGDCYYCVAGLPDDGYIGEQRDHADACVQLGLEMIAIIADVKNEFKLDINMRIGVHTGSIIGGIIGITKWQFDIWSKDVYIANRMETAGQAGKVHITGQTKEQLKKQYRIELSDAGTRDPELKKHQIDCYLISPEPNTHQYTNGTVNGVSEELPLNVSRLPDHHYANGTVSEGRRPSQYIRRGSVAPNRPSNRNAAANIGGRRRFTPNTLSRRTPFMDNNLSRFHERLQQTDRQMEEAVQTMPLSKYDQWFKIKDINPLVLIFRNLSTELDFIKQPDPLFKYYILSDLLILTCVVAIQNFAQTEYNASTSIEVQPVLIQQYYLFSLIFYTGERHMTETCALIIIINFTFLRIHLWLKVIVATVITAGYSFFLWHFDDAFHKGSEALNHEVSGPVAHIVFIIYLTLTLHFIDRQSDYMHRLDHQWRTRLNEEQEQAHFFHDVNFKLLNNILPGHVADYYTDSNRKNGLYYEEYTENNYVAVMFASILNYDKDMPDKILLSYLSGMITAFDQILLDKYDNVVEKIKIANWTYMAASGLDPGRRYSGKEGKRARRNAVLSLLNFAVDIKKRIKEIDREFQYPKLRIGIAHGPVTAGVVGSKKPLYDIWGDPVNMASRMESTGREDHIQVMQETAKIIQDHGFSCTFRGYTFVKGRSTEVPTYFVDVDEDDNLIRTF